MLHYQGQSSAQYYCVFEICKKIQFNETKQNKVAFTLYRLQLEPLSVLDMLTRV